MASEKAGHHSSPCGEGKSKKAKGKRKKDAEHSASLIING
jgi:hypothetical protein